MTAIAEISPRLAAAGVRHGFFGRAGGVSRPPYETLNAGPGSADDPASVSENRRRCAASLGVSPDCLLTVYQRHTSRVAIVDGPWGDDGPPEADGMATTTHGLAIGALAADCMPALFVDSAAGVIGAAHAGWRGALGGILESTIAAMARLGADPSRIVGAIGPCLRPPFFEVGEDLVDMFVSKHPEADSFFSISDRPDKRQLDLVGFGLWRLATTGVQAMDIVGGCTLAEPHRYFSHRDGQRRGLPDYGRNLSAIALP
ncbi:MAG: peptidoglycan editing factor PgeF [Alphaproteobacteria bacterium]|nr:peptidoglycan editing factor PgeF [Alphaproteobacteria bacterium]